ncbi:hypothetical protein BTVI_125434 [Pitangus sulphuratus]|nr:hypothetical protein BTVI_125434 [Pitangus sulphuratus]
MGTAFSEDPDAAVVSLVAELSLMYSVGQAMKDINASSLKRLSLVDKQRGPILWVISMNFAVLLSKLNITYPVNLEVHYFYTINPVL